MTILLVTGCGGNVEPSTDDALSSGASTAATGTPEISAAALPTAESTPSPAALQGELVSNPYGTFVQVPLSEDSPAYVVDPATFVVDSANNKLLVTDTFTDADVASAQRVIVDFMSTEAINSTLNNAASLPPEELAARRNQWWADNQSQIAPEWKENLQASFTTDRPMVILEAWQKDLPTYRYVYGDNEPRIRDLVIKPQETYATPDLNVVVKAGVAYNTNTVQDGKALLSPQQSYGTLTYAVRSDGNGGWLITGYLNNVQTIQGWPTDTGDSEADIFVRDLLAD